jgi:predicted RNase H-like nuclease (RuvC/YqgF family)
VAAALADATDEQIREYENELRYIKSKAQADLQQSVLQNRTQFIKISKEAEKLKTEMRALKNLMAELKTNTMALLSAARRGTSEADLSGSLTIGMGMSKRDKRSSVQDRSALWNTQLQVGGLSGL